MSSDESRPALIVSGAMIGTFLLIDYVVPQVTGPDLWMSALVGICAGQVNLIATWAVMAPGNIVVRLPWALLLSVLMWYSLVLGNRAGPSDIPLNDAVLLGTVVVGGALVAQIPLWIAKIGFRWRLIGLANEALPSPEAERQFSLGHLLVATFLLSVALSPMRTVLPQGEIGGVHLDIEAFVTLAVVVLCNFVVTVPCIWGALAATANTALLAFGWLVYCLVLTVVEFFALVSIQGAPGGQVGEILLFMFLLNVSQCVTVFGVLRLFRALGFRLVRRPRGGNESDRSTLT